MADFPQSPYGVHFPPPHPSHAQHSQHPQHAPPGPPLPPSGQRQQFSFPQIPGLNMTAYPQNFQPPQNQFWPPAPPVPQQTAYGFPFPPPPHPQHGFPIPPPPLPPPGFVPHEAVLRGASQPFPTPTQPQPTRIEQPAAPALPVSDRVVEMVESDREEGEVSEGDGHLAGTGTLVNPPRSIPESSQSAPRNDNRNGYHDNASTLDRKSRGFDYAAQTTLGRSSQPQSPGAYGPALLINKREAAKAFVKILHENNLAYSKLAEEDLDAQALRALYQDLNISQPEPAAPPVQAPKIMTPVAPALQSASSPLGLAVPPTAAGVQDVSRTSSPAVTPGSAQPAAVKAAPAPVNRKDYIARLQAAKAGKQPSMAKAPQPEQAQPSPAAGAQVTSSVIKTTSPPTGTNTASKTSNATTEAPRLPPPNPSASAPIAVTQPPKINAEKTELIRKKLALMKKERELSNSSTPQPPEAFNNVANAKLAQSESVASKDTAKRPLAQGGSFPQIPGLFMNSSLVPASSVLPVKPALGPALSGHNSPSPAAMAAKLPAKPPSSAHDGNGPTTRRRPVAADFDDVTTPASSGPAYTRPLGQSPHEHDSESMIIEVSDDESGGSEMDLEDDQADAMPSTLTLTSIMRNGAQNFRNQPPLSDFPPRFGSSLPASAVNTPPAISTPSDLPSKGKLEDYENEMRRLKEKIAKMEQQKKNVAQTHAPAPVPSSSANLPSGPKTNGKAMATTAKTAGLHKKRRRSVIESDLQALLARIHGDETRLAQLEKETLEIKAQRERYLQERERLTTELESYGIETQGMTNDELQAEKDKIDSQKDAVLGSQTALSGTAEEFLDKIALPVHTVTEAAESGSDHGKNAEPQIITVTNGLGASSAPQQDLEATASSQMGAPVPSMPVSEDTTVPATPMVDDEDFYSPEPVVPAAPSQHQPAETAEPGDRSDALPEEGEVEMSESSVDEEEYVPEEMQGILSAQDIEVTEGTKLPASPTPISEVEGEVYEPPEPGQITSISPRGSASIGVVEKQSVDANEQVEMDVSMSSSDESESAQEEEDESTGAPGASISHIPSSDVVVVSDDLAPELQPQNLPTMVSNEEQALPPDAGVDKARYVPYKSPLQIFKSYRFHPSYPQEVAGGYLSLTYSHQIDPFKPLCRFESVGGTCNDPHCHDQHFRDMNISADKLLVELGTANPGKSPEANKQYVEGLKQVLQDIRSKNKNKDPTGIIQEIVNYRRQFLNDDTRVLNL